MADELMEILSAPSLRSALKSSTVRMPPPTVKGMNTVSATLRTMSTTVCLASEEAVISRNTSSSAPSLSYALPISTGSPASLRSTKFTPFTTRPLFTSRQGMILFVCTFSYPSVCISTKFFRICIPVSLLFSGWNWQANTFPFSTEAWISVPYSVTAVTIPASSARR